MNTNQRALELLRRAVAILEDETQEPNGQPEINEGEVVLVGTIGRPETREVGRDNILLFTAGLKTVRDQDGRTEWVNIQAWRKVAAWAGENLPAGTRTQAIGRYERQEWTTQEGEIKERTIFSVRMFAPV